MKCPLCDEEIVFERNLKKHQKGKVCKGFVFERRMRAEGWSPLHNRYRPWLDDAGIAYVIGPVMYIGGFQQRVIHIRTQTWVPNKIAGIISLREGLPTFVGRIHTERCSIHRVKELLREEGNRARQRDAP